MNPSGNGQMRFYRVIVSAAIRQQIKNYHGQAQQENWEDEFMVILDQINFRLRTDPYNLGEPLYRLPGLNLLVCHAVIRVIAVDFGIHQKLPFVFLKGFKLLSD